MLQNRAFNGLVPCFCSLAGLSFSSTPYQHIYLRGWSLVTDGCKWLYWGLSITPESHFGFTLNARDMQISPVLIIYLIYIFAACFSLLKIYITSYFDSVVVEDITKSKQRDVLSKALLLCRDLLSDECI